MNEVLIHAIQIGLLVVLVAIEFIKIITKQ